MLFRLYTPILVLQAFCLFHAYKTRADQKWFYLIIFIPIVGCLFYLYDQFYNRRTVSVVTETVKTAFVTNYTIEKLENELQFSDSVTNRINLANEYMKYERYGEAATLFERSLEGFMADDPKITMRLLHARYLNKDYDIAIAIGRTLDKEPLFKKSEERVAYAWALHLTGKTPEAAEQFADMDRSFTNHEQRKEYARFLMETGQKEKATALLDELVTEFDQMKEIERRINREVYREVKGMRASLGTTMS